MNGTTDYVELYGNTNDPAVGQKAIAIMAVVYLGK
jgi:hypothetical protein